MVLCCRDTTLCRAAAPPAHISTCCDPQLSAQRDLPQPTCCSLLAAVSQHGPQQTLATRPVKPDECSQPTFYFSPARLLLTATLCRCLWLLGTARLHSVSRQCHCQQRFVLRLLHEQ